MVYIHLIVAVKVIASAQVVDTSVNVNNNSFFSELH